MGGGMQWHQLDHMQTICTSLLTDNHTNTSSLNVFTGRMLFLTPNQQRQSTEGSRDKTRLQHYSNSRDTTHHETRAASNQTSRDIKEEAETRLIFETDTLPRSVKPIHTQYSLLTVTGWHSVVR